MNGSLTLRTWLSSFRELFSNRLILVGNAILLFWLFAAVFAEYIAPYPAQGLNGVPDPSAALKPPNSTHIFGTTELGLDIFSRVLFGARIALMVGIIATVVNVSIGYPMGVLAGYLRGRFDELITRVTDVFLAFPTILMAILIVTSIGPGLWSMLLALAVTRWPAFVRLARAQTLSLRERSFVLAARGMGEGSLTIITKHIALNALQPIIIVATTDVGFVILADAGLSFLGLGVLPPAADWGLTIAQSIRYFPLYWWYATFPGISLFTLATAFALIGDGLGEHLDPKLRKRTWIFSRV